MDNLVREALKLDPLLQLRPPADEAELASAETALDLRLPHELRRFLLQANGAMMGVELPTGEIIPDASPLIWSLSEIVERNRGLASSGDRSPSDVLFFADVGADGLLVGHPVGPDQAAAAEVVVFSPIERRISMVAESLREWLLGWLGGSITV